jgi:abortive infection bacteriophage resistance protein
MIREPKAKEIFKDGSSFEQIFKIYQFDSDLRTIVFQAIEQIEIAVRTQMIYHFSHKYKSGFWYTDVDAFKHYPSYVSLLSKVTKNVSASKQEFILKYQANYTQFLPPSWKSFEILTFSTLLAILKNIKNHKDLIPVAKSFGLHHSVLLSWVETFVYVRNICAHHSRFWNIVLTISPTWIKNPQGAWVDRWENEERNIDTDDKVLRTYAALCCIQYCLCKINPYSHFRQELQALINKYSTIDISQMGFPDEWQDQPLWKDK